MRSLWRRKTLRVFVHSEALHSIREECRLWDDVETGGILIGYHTEQAIVIRHATSAGPQAKHLEDSLEMDLDFISTELKRFETLNRLGYEGNWHTHPRSKWLTPSTTDINLMRDVVDSGNYDIEAAIGMIVPAEPIGTSDFHCFLFRKQKRDFIKIAPIEFN